MMLPILIPGIADAGVVFLLRGGRQGHGGGDQSGQYESPDGRLEKRPAEFPKRKLHELLLGQA
jgi:hypothetical protein